MEEVSRDKLLEEDLKRVERESMAKAMRHRLDEYIAIVLGLGTVLLLWFLQALGLY